MERPIACDRFGIDASSHGRALEIVDDAHDVSGAKSRDADGSPSGRRTTALRPQRVQTQTSTLQSDTSISGQGSGVPVTVGRDSADRGCAPRCLGVAATSSSVAAPSRASNPYTTLALHRAISRNSDGSVNTT